MISLDVTAEHMEKAKALFEFKKLNNSITEGDGNLAGALGEILVCEYYKGIQQNTFDYDLIIKSLKIDVKTKRYTARFTPSLKWNLNIPDFNTTQDCDYYCFVGMPDDYSKAYIYGFILKSKFYEIATFGAKDEIDPYGDGKWTYRADCYNILVSRLKLDIFK
jgi:hypothetical protein